MSESGGGLMVYLRSKQVTLNSKEFAKNLVQNRYNLRNEEIQKTKLVYSSEWTNPSLYRVNNYNFKMFYLANQLQREMSNLGVEIQLSKIKEDSLKKEVVVYQKMLLDKRTGKLVDYFFVLDSRMFKVLIYKRETDFSKEQDRVFRAVKYLHDEIYLDFEKIFWVLTNNGFNVTSEMVSHMVAELM